MKIVRMVPTKERKGSKTMARFGVEFPMLINWDDEDVHAATMFGFMLFRGGGVRPPSFRAGGFTRWTSLFRYTDEVMEAIVRLARKEADRMRIEWDVEWVDETASPELPATQ